MTASIRHRLNRKQVTRLSNNTHVEIHACPPSHLAVVSPILLSGGSPSLCGRSPSGLLVRAILIKWVQLVHQILELNGGEVDKLSHSCF